MRRARLSERRSERRREVRRIGEGGAAHHEGRRPGIGVHSLTRDASPEPGNGAESEMYKETRLEAPPTRKAEAKMAHEQVWKVAPLNVKSIRKPTMHLQVGRYMEERNIAVLCLQETWVPQTTQYVVGDLLYVMHGHGKEEREYAGVGFVARKMSGNSSQASKSAGMEE